MVAVNSFCWIWKWVWQMPWEVNANSCDRCVRTDICKCAYLSTLGITQKGQRVWFYVQFKRSWVCLSDSSYIFLKFSVVFSYRSCLLATVRTKLTKGDLSKQIEFQLRLLPLSALAAHKEPHILKPITNLITLSQFVYCHLDFVQENILKRCKVQSQCHPEIHTSINCTCALSKNVRKQLACKTSKVSLIFVQTDSSRKWRSQHHLNSQW